jgi:mannonate dehydratase
MGRPTATTRIDEYDPGNCKLGHIVRWDAPDADLLFCKQLGLHWVRLLCGSEDPHVDALRRVRDRFATFGLSIWSAVHDAHRSLKIQLGQEGRDEDIGTYCTFLRSLGQLGIPVAAYDFHPGNTYTTAHVERRGYVAREFDLGRFKQELEETRFEREYPAEEMWANYAYFIGAVLPVAEEAGVALALHPDDPPLAWMNGVAKLFAHCDGFRRADEIAGASAHWGLNLCVGTWAEGGDRMGVDVLGLIRDYGSRSKILDVHFRNVSAPMPHFVETFPDDGYLDMYAVMAALREVGYAGAILPDHIPQLAGDDGFRRAGVAYCIAYIRALLRRANEEVG